MLQRNDKHTEPVPASTLAQGTRARTCASTLRKQIVQMAYDKGFSHVNTKNLIPTLSYLDIKSVAQMSACIVLIGELTPTCNDVLGFVIIAALPDKTVKLTPFIPSEHSERSFRFQSLH